MTEYVLPILGIVFSVALIKYRERVGDVFGEPDWLRPVGGIYLALVYLAVFIIIWSIATLTGTTDVLFGPVLWLFPTLRSGGTGARPDLSY